MEREIARLRPVTLVMPKPVGSHVIRAKTKRDTLKELNRLTKRGYVLEASPIAQFHANAGGGFGVKVALAKPLPAPLPGWAKGAAVVGVVLIGLALATTALLRALASLIPAAAAIPWAMIAGGAFVFLIVAGIVRRVIVGGSITVNQNVTINR